MSREEFIENIKKWVVLDRQIKQLNDQIKRLNHLYLFFVLVFLPQVLLCLYELFRFPM